MSTVAYQSARSGGYARRRVKGGGVERNVNRPSFWGAMKCEGVGFVAA